MTQSRTLILCYHSIGPQAHGLRVSLQNFREQIRFLKEHGYRFATVGELAARVSDAAHVPHRIAAITFDDGFEDNYTAALPILLENSIRATFFITSGLVFGDGRARSWFAQRVGPDEPWLRPQQLREMHGLGMEIGAHTHTHPNLAKLNAEQARWELTHARELLEDAVGTAITVMAYPFGRPGIHHTSGTRAIARQCGYVAAASTASRTLGRREDLMRLPRFFVTSRDTCETIRQKMRGDVDWLGWYHEVSPGWLKRVISPEENYA